uniref:Septin-type G domain-containing protein n=1 Tax=Mycena chlorophos TaxID=658473 RepID=A0ABQ0LPN2_MYCCL|nr:predicted protein [Mycena chlorophos]
MPARTTTTTGGAHHRSQLSDPLSFVLQPPADETPTQRTARLAKEQEEKRVSDAIDEDLRKERNDKKKRSKREVKVLLLGQSESGKSTVLKNFRLKYAPAQWKAELRSWRSVIQLNLVHNVVTILDVLSERLAALDGASSNANTPSSSPLPVTASSSYSNGSATSGGRTSFDSTLSDMTFLSSATAAAAAARVPLTPKHRLLLLRLSPLRKVAEDLRRTLGGGAEGQFANGDDDATFGGHGVLDAGPSGVRKKAEFAVRGWITALGLREGRKSGEEDGSESPTDSTTEILFSLRDDILALWEDPDVRALLRAANLRIEDRAGFFLPDTARITALGYIPSDNDVVRARLRTLGVQEWRVVLEPGAGGLGNSGLGLATRLSVAAVSLVPHLRSHHLRNLSPRTYVRSLWIYFRDLRTALIRPAWGAVATATVAFGIFGLGDVLREAQSRLVANFA